MHDDELTATDQPSQMLFTSSSSSTTSSSPPSSALVSEVYLQLNNRVDLNFPACVTAPSHHHQLSHDDNCLIHSRYVVNIEKDNNNRKNLPKKAQVEIHGNFR
jgi:hypothetical protein